MCITYITLRARGVADAARGPDNTSHICVAWMCVCVYNSVALVVFHYVYARFRTSESSSRTPS